MTSTSVQESLCCEKILFVIMNLALLHVKDIEKSVIAASIFRLF